MSSKERLDILLVNRGLFESREKAKAAIMPELPQAAGGELCPAHANLRFWQRG